MLAFEMNRRGPAGCRANVDRIVSDILPRARKLAATRHPRAMQAAGKLGRVGQTAADAAISRRLRRLVLRACELAECESAGNRNP